MKKMNIPLMATLLALSIIVCPILYFTVGPALDSAQLETLKILGIIAACSAAFCFIVGELTGNNSQMDKLWSLLPIAYTWVIVRSGAPFKNKRWAWAAFDLGFISIYQNALVLMTTFPALVAMSSDAPFGWIDCLAAVFMLGFIIWKTIADEQQWAFQTKKWTMLNEGKKLEELPAPYNKGFNTTGLWARSRHPNYFAEQGTWVAFYVFSIGAGMGILNWSVPRFFPGRHPFI